MSELSQWLLALKAPGHRFCQWRPPDPRFSRIFGKVVDLGIGRGCGGVQGRGVPLRPSKYAGWFGLLEMNGLQCLSQASNNAPPPLPLPCPTNPLSNEHSCSLRTLLFAGYGKGGGHRARRFRITKRQWCTACPGILSFGFCFVCVPKATDYRRGHSPTTSAEGLPNLATQANGSQPHCGAAPLSHMWHVGCPVCGGGGVGQGHDVLLLPALRQPAPACPVLPCHALFPWRTPPALPCPPRSVLHCPVLLCPALPCRVTSLSCPVLSPARHALDRPVLSNPLPTPCQCPPPPRSSGQDHAT